MGKFILCLSLVQKIQRWLVGPQRKNLRRGNGGHGPFAREDRVGSLPQGNPRRGQVVPLKLNAYTTSAFSQLIPEHTSGETVHANTYLLSTNPGFLSTLRISGCFSCPLPFKTFNSSGFKCKAKPILYENSKEVLFLVTPGIFHHPRNTHLNT